MTLDARLLEILACPSDKGPLLYFSGEASLYNPRLRLRYRVEDGIPVMLLDEADPVDDTEHGRLLAKAEADGVGPTFLEAGRGGDGAGCAGRRTMATEDLFEALRHLPDQVRDAAVAAADVKGLPAPGEVSEVVIIGAGGGGVAGDVVESVAHLQGSAPVLATGGLSPAWLSETSLVVAVSQSGDDRPTVAAARAARASGAHMVAVTSGGELMALCTGWGVPMARVDPKVGPEAGLGVVIVPVLVLLERVGVLEGMNRLISDSAEQIEARSRLMDADHAPVEALAAGVQDRMTVVCGAGGVGKHAARRWVNRLNRVGDVASMRRNLPADEAEAATWATLARGVPAGVAAVVLRHDFEPPGLADRVDLLGSAVTALHEVRAEGEGALAQLLDLVLVGDAVAALAAQRGRATSPDSS